MLIILHGSPVSAPGEAVFCEKLIAQIVFINFVGKIQTSVRIGPSCGRGYALLPVRPGYIGIVQGIDVDCKPVSMLREAAGAVHHPEIKAGGVVVFHGKRIVPAVFIHQPDALQRISGQIQLIKNLNEILGDRLVADDLANLFFAVEIDIQNIQIPKVLIGNDAVLSVGYSCDPFLYSLA